MDDRQKAELVVHIKEAIVAARADIAAYEQLCRPVSPDNAIGRLTRLDAMNSKSINEAALDTAKHKLAKLERALSMIDDPDFGLCQMCEEPIPRARLMAVPEADLCVQCAEKVGR